MDEARVIRLSWDEWRAGRAAKRAALAAHGLSGESRRTSARPEARRQLQFFCRMASKEVAVKRSEKGMSPRDALDEVT